MISRINNTNFKAIYHSNSSEDIHKLVEKIQPKDSIALIIHSDKNKDEIIGDFFLATEEDAQKTRNTAIELLKAKAPFNQVLKALTEEFFEKTKIRPRKEKDIQLVAVEEISKNIFDSEYKIRLFSPEGQLEL